MPAPPSPAPPSGEKRLPKGWLARLTRLPAIQYARRQWLRLWGWLPRPWLWATAASLLILYTILGFFAVPPLVRSQLISQIESRFDRQATIERVTSNPYTLRLDIVGMHIPDRQGADVLSFERLSINLSTASLWRWGLAFDEILIEAPRLKAERRSDDTINLLDFVPPPSEVSEEPVEQATPIRLWIDRLALIDGSAQFLDHTRDGPFQKQIEHLAFVLMDFTTVEEGNRFTMEANGDQGEHLFWQGTFNLYPLMSDGRFEVTAIHLASLAEWGGSAVPFVLPSGTFDIAGNYKFQPEAGSPVMTVDIMRTSLNDVTVRERAATAEWISLTEAAATGIHLDLNARSVDIGNISVSDPYAFVAMAPDGRLNLMRLMPETGGESGNGKPADTPQWTVSAPDIQVANGKLDIEDQTQATPVKYALNGLSLSAKGFAWPPRDKAMIDARAAVDSDGRFSVTGALGMEPVSADLSLEVSRIDLTPLQPYLDAMTGIRLTSGAVSLAGQAQYSANDGVRFTGDMSLDDFRTVDAVLDEALVSWQRVAATGISAQSSPPAANIERIVVREPQAKLVIATDRTVNIAVAMSPQTDRAAQPAVPLSPQEASAEAPAAPPPRQALPAEIGEIVIENGILDFADYSIQPNVVIKLQELNGRISGLSGRQDARADLSLEGSVDRYAPATIQGQVNFLAAETFTDVTMDVRNVELSTLSPYSGRFAGYEVRRGKLNLDLHYIIDNGQLMADHHVVVDNLQLGERVESPEATSLPVRLAIALLTDSNGVIDLDIPVEGSLDDPQFRLGDVIGTIVVNLITKIVTSPFALLGALVGGGEDIQFIEFAPGSATLDEDALARIDDLRQALIERPGISYDVPITYSPELDGRLFRQEALNARITAIQNPDEAAEASDSPTKEGAILPLDKRMAALELLYIQTFGMSPAFPEGPAKESIAMEATAAPAAQSGQTQQPMVDMTEDYIAWLEERLLTVMEAPRGRLQALGNARASAVQDAFLAGGDIEPGRIFIITQAEPAPSEAPEAAEGEEEKTDKDDRVRMQLDITR